MLSLHTALNALEKSAGVEKTTLADIFGFVADEDAIAVKPTEFYGFEPLDAAKRYLRKTRENGAELADIIEGVKAGGLALSRDDEDAIRTGLSRSTLDTAKIGGRYVLLEFLPHVKRGKKGRPRTFKEAVETSTEIAAGTADLLENQKDESETESASE